MQSTSSQPTRTLPRAALAWETLGFLCYRGRAGGRKKKQTHKFSLSYLKINIEHILPVQGAFNGHSSPTSSGRRTGDQGGGHPTHLGSSRTWGATGLHSQSNPPSLILQCLATGLGSHFRLSLEKRGAFCPFPAGDVSWRPPRPAWPTSTAHTDCSVSSQVPSQNPSALGESFCGFCLNPDQNST